MYMYVMVYMEVHLSLDKNLWRSRVLTIAMSKLELQDVDFHGRRRWSLFFIQHPQLPPGGVPSAGTAPRRAHTPLQGSTFVSAPSLGLCSYGTRPTR